MIEARNEIITVCTMKKEANVTYTYYRNKKKLGGTKDLDGFTMFYSYVDSLQCFSNFVGSSMELKDKKLYLHKRKNNYSKISNR